MATDKLKIFVERMKKVGVEITLAGNYPWVYIDTINGQRVIETFQANHGFTIAFLPIKIDDDEIKFTDIGEIFKLIRKYLNTITGYKLVRKMKDGSLSPLFINKTSRFPIGVWLEAKSYPTKGFAVRKGFHCTLTPVAPHLSTNNRVWVEVELQDYEHYDRPESQGGTWVLAQKMKVIREL
jgi:hypothetical protein